MRYCYDEYVDALAIQLLPDERVVRTLDIDDDRHVDLDGMGHVVAIDIRNASHGVKIDDLIDGFDLHVVENFLRSVASQTFQSWSIAY